MSYEEYDGWLIGIVRKRSPEVLRVLVDVVSAGLALGHASANDVKSAVDHPNVIGAAFKLLPRVGFVCDGLLTKAREKRKHGRRLFVYRLASRYHAEKFMRECQRQLDHLLQNAPPEPQPMLPKL